MKFKSILKRCFSMAIAASLLMSMMIVPSNAYGNDFLSTYSPVPNNYEGDEGYDEGFWFDGEEYIYVTHRAPFRNEPYVGYLRDYSTPKHTSGRDEAGPFWGVDEYEDNRYMIINPGSYWTQDNCIEDAYTFTIDVALGKAQTRLEDGTFDGIEIPNVADKFAGVRMYTCSYDYTDAMDTSLSSLTPGTSGIGFNFSIGDDTKDELIIYALNSDKSVIQAAFPFPNGTFDDWTTFKVTDKLDGIMNIYVNGRFTAIISIDGSNVTIMDTLFKELAKTTDANIYDKANFHVVNANEGDFLVDNVGVKYYEEYDDSLESLYDDYLFYYNRTNDDVSVYKYNGESTEVTIPSEINGKNVVAIHDSCFKDNNNITSVSIPNSIKVIGDSAFENCKSLIIINLPNSITEIGNYAFSGCSSLTSIDIPQNVTNIGASAFEKCQSLARVEILDSNVTIGSRCFYNCYSLIEVDFGKNVTEIGDSAFYGCKSLTSIDIPQNVTNIGASAFEECQSLARVEILDSNATIGSRCFYNCDSLVEVNLGNNVTEIGNKAFQYCDSLVDIKIPKSVTNIGDGAFETCQILTKVEILDSKASIGNYCFNYCTNLKEIELGNNITSFGKNCFSNCTNLKKIKIPDSISEIDVTAFSNCDNLKIIEVSKDNPNYTNIDGVLYDKEMTKVIFFPEGKSGDYEIPKNILENNSTAFNGCGGLTSIFLPTSLTSVLQNSFSSCSRLINVYVQSGTSSIGYEAFSNCYNLKSITIPKSVTAIMYGAFDSCYNLNHVFYEGSQAEWNKMVIAASNDYLKNATIHFNVTLGSEFNKNITQKATCSSGAMTEHYCSQCNSCIFSLEDTNTMLEHSYTKYVSNNDATCQKNGTLSAYCDNDCGEIDIIVDEGTMLEHAYDNGACIYCGASKSSPGDVSGDGNISSADVTLLRRYIAGWEINKDVMIGDINKDGNISSADVSLIRRYIAGWDVTLSTDKTDTDVIVKNLSTSGRFLASGMSADKYVLNFYTGGENDSGIHSIGNHDLSRYNNIFITYSTDAVSSIGTLQLTDASGNVISSVKLAPSGGWLVDTRTKLDISGSSYNGQLYLKSSSDIRNGFAISAIILT